jgi:hypothetical protein
MNCKVCNRPMKLIFTSYGCDYCDDKIPEVSFTGYARVKPPELWIALILDTGYEVAAPGYHRMKATVDISGWNWQGVRGTFTWPQATSSWGLVVRGDFMDAETGGNCVYHVYLRRDAFNNPGCTVGKDDILSIAVDVSMT